MQACDGRPVSGAEYLDAVTRLLQRRRLAAPAREMWEAADLQWWWPRDRHPDPADARIWSDEAGPVAGVVITRWSPQRLSCEVLADADFTPAWSFARRRSQQLAPVALEMEMVVEGDLATQQAAGAIGYVPTEAVHSVSWLPATAVREPARPLADGYRIAGRDELDAHPHPMIARNGLGVEAALRECSLYDPHLDLAIIAADDTIAGYALFWADPVTQVGLVEPMRVEDAHAGRGLATHLLAAGMRRLTDRGCTRLKVAAELSNPVAQRLYSGAGFVIDSHTRSWRHAPARGDGDG